VGPACTGLSAHLAPIIELPGCGIWSLTWRFGDGDELPAGGVLDPVDHVYAAAGTYNGSLELASLAGCQASYPFTVQVGVNVVPSGAVGNVLKAAKSGSKLWLSWAAGAPLDPPSYNVHATPDRTRLVPTALLLGATPVVASSAQPEAVLNAPPASIYLSVVGRETCTGKSVLP
jgi:hypothetical protein